MPEARRAASPNQSQLRDVRVAERHISMIQTCTAARLRVMQLAGQAAPPGGGMVPRAHSRRRTADAPGHALGFEWDGVCNTA